jgi:hypothetical protein
MSIEELDDEYDALTEHDLIIAFHPDADEFSVVMPEDGRLTRFQHQKLEEVALLSDPSFVLKGVMWIELKFKLFILYLRETFSPDSQD